MLDFVARATASLVLPDVLKRCPGAIVVLYHSDGAFLLLLELFVELLGLLLASANAATRNDILELLQTRSLLGPSVRAMCWG